MNSFGVFDRRRVGYAAFAIVTAITLTVSALVSAATVTERSIELSSSSAGANGVSYKVNFKAAQAAGAFVLDFCENSPIVGQACDAPAGFSVTNATSATTGFTDVSDLDENTVVVTGAMAADDPVSVDLDNVDNPDADGPLYARIVTYAADTDADSYTSTNLGANSVDTGGVAISINDTIGVSAAVLESLTLCIAGEEIAVDCDTTNLDPPTLTLGEDTGGTIALTPGQVSEGAIHTQISTNAIGGAVVRLKSNAVGCGGLLRAGDLSACDIAPALTSGVDGTAARFGVKTAAATTTGSDPVGTLQPYSDSPYYNNSTYRLNYVIGDATGVTSTYGDPFLDTDDAPANNQNMELTFGASATNATPAGLYSADLSMIAAGKF